MVSSMITAIRRRMGDYKYGYNKADEDDGSITPLNEQHAVKYHAVSGKEIEEDDDDLESGCAICHPKYPHQVGFIIGNEFCERFSYYGMRAVLVLYLTRALSFDNDLATTVYHAFVACCYFTPIFGAMIADSFLGKFKTIFFISILYAAGNVVMAVTSIDAQLWGAILGLTLIAIGTGGIKPCVAPFGADQFLENQTSWRESFFSMFYFAINAGSLVAIFLTPELRSIACFGSDTCYFLAFGVPAVFMVVALVLFVVGYKWYIHVPVSDNIVWRMMCCIGRGIQESCCCGSKVEADHWLDRAYPAHSKTFIRDVKAALNVLLMFIPLPVFWTLFEQQGSRWVLQAAQMDGYVSFLNWYIKPDQIQIANPLLILIMVPIFDALIYKCFDKIGFPLTPLKRMVTGGVLVAAAFIIAGILQLEIDKTLDNSVPRVQVINTYNCPTMTISENGGAPRTIAPYETYSMKEFSFPGGNPYMLEIKTCASSVTHVEMIYPSTLNDGYWMIYNTQRSVKPVIMVQLSQEGDKEENYHPDPDRTLLAFAYLSEEMPGRNAKAIFRLGDYQPTPGKEISAKQYRIVAVSDESGRHLLEPQGNEKYGQLEYMKVEPGVWHLDYQYEDAAGNVVTETYNKLDRMGYASFSTYQMFTRNESMSHVNADPHTEKKKNSVSMLLQLPQFFVITCGEVLFSVTGLGFAYSQAPMSMRSVLQAGWLLTNAFGNLLTILIIDLITFPSQAWEFFIFGIGLFVTMGVFAIMSIFYKYVDQDELSKPIEDDDEDEKPTARNPYVTNPEKIVLSPPQPALATSRVEPVQSKEEPEYEETSEL